MSIEIGSKLDLFKIGERGFNCDELFTSLSNSKNTKVWSWGAHAWVTHEDKWLRFKSNGHHHKGHVYITLGFDDTFTIYYTNTRAKVIDMVTGVYVGSLIDTIDNRIERIANYKY